MAVGGVKTAVLVVGVVLSCSLLLLYPVCGDNPSYTECRPHIDATIRNLAAKAIVAGEVPPHTLTTDDYASEGVAPSDAQAQEVPPVENSEVSPEQKSEVTLEPAEPLAPEVPSPPAERPSPEKVPSPSVPEESPAPEKPPVIAEEQLLKPKESPEAPAPIVSKEPSADEVKHEAPAAEGIVEAPAAEEIVEAPAAAKVVEAPAAAKVVEAPAAEVSAARDEKQSAALPESAAHKEPIPKKELKPTGIIDKLVNIIFGLSPHERDDKKWQQPWQTHEEFKKKPVDKPVEVKIDRSKGGFVHSFVSIFFGEPAGDARDPKWAEPWQTHKEHKKQPKKEPEPLKQVEATGGIFNKFVDIIFGEYAKEVRDSKWSQPWQTHKEHQKKAKDEPIKVKKIPVVSSGGIIDSFVKLIFAPAPEVGKRDPKWLQPWQTHPEFSKKGVKAEEKVEKEKVRVDTSGGLINSFVKLFFTTTPEDAMRDHKWSKPWQTHPEHTKKPVKVEEPKEKVRVDTSGGLINSFVKLFFTTTPEDAKRDSKWSQPWQTHPEHTKKPVKVEEPKEKVRVDTSGGLINSFVKLIFTTTPEDAKRDPKWAQPWQSHKEFKKAPASGLQPAKAKDVPAYTPAHEPEVAPAPKPEPAAVPKPEPVHVPVAEPKPAVEEPTVAEATFPAKKVAGAGADAAPAAAPAGAQPVADAPQAPQQQVLVEKAATPQVPQAAPALEEEEEQIVVVPTAFRSRDRLEAILGLDESSQHAAARTDPIADATLKELKKIYESTIKPLEMLYKYQDISNRHVSDAELFGTPLILLVGPYSTGKSSFINYLLGVEYTKRALKTGTPPSHGVFRVVQFGEQDTELDGTDLSAHWSFTSLQKFGQNFIDQLQGKAFNSPLLKKVTFVEAPGILEMRRPGERLYPFNDVAQWFIDRADLILVMFDHTKLDAGYELEAILDQLKGREAQTRILLNKADQVPAEELIKVQGSLFWNLSPLLGVSTPPTVYAGSFVSRPYRTSSPATLFQAQEDALFTDIALAINSRVDNRIAIARRHAVRVRNHAQMVDTYLTTYYKNKGFLTSKHKLAEDIVENPHTYNIYEGVGLLTNISRYDLPDPEIYRDFFKVHNLFDFQTLKETCSFFRGCPLSKIDAAISTDLPELLERYRRLLEAAIAAPGPKRRAVDPVPAPSTRGSVPAAATARTS